MHDDEFISRFEDCTLRKESFHHADHIRLVWIYLHRYSILETLSRFPGGLRKLAATFGKPNLYHETITWAYILLVNERIQDQVGQPWEEFVCSNSDLFEWPSTILRDCYREETLRSETARRAFLFPDRHGHLIPDKQVD